MAASLTRSELLRSELPPRSLPPQDTFPFRKLESIQFSSEAERQRYTCVCCKEILKPPVKQTMCGHRLCTTCLEKIKHEGGNIKCPGGEEECIFLDAPGSSYPDVSIVRELNNMIATCENASYGCTDRIPLKNIMHHEANCRYKPVECPNTRLGCKIGKIAACKLDDHLRTCKQGTCKHCKKQMLQEDLSEHEKSCYSNPTDCQFKKLGCQAHDIPKKLEQHSKSDVHQHLEMLLNKVVCVEAELADAKAELLKKKGDVNLTEQEVEKIQTDFEKSVKKYHEVQKQIAGQNQKILKFQDETSQQIQELQKKLDDMKKAQDNLDRHLQQKQSGGRTTELNVGSLGPELARIQNYLAAQEIQFREFDLRFQCLETANYDGVLIWKIRDFRRRKQEAKEGRILSLYSQPFYTSKFGYKMCARVYLNGDGMGKGTHLSLFFVVMKGDYDALLPWPFRQKVTLTLLDQVEGNRHLSDTFRPDQTSTSFKRPTGEMNIASGCPLFVSQAVLENPPYLKDDTIYIKVTVDTTDCKSP